MKDGGTTSSLMTAVAMVTPGNGPLRNLQMNDFVVVAFIFFCFPLCISCFVCLLSWLF